MKRLKIFTTRIMMSILLMAALSTTFYSISGVHVKSVAASLYENVKEDSGRSYLYHSLKSIEGAFISLRQTVESASQISSVEAVTREMPNLETAFDWSKYPAKK